MRVENEHIVDHLQLILVKLLHFDRLIAVFMVRKDSFPPHPTCFKTEYFGLWLSCDLANFLKNYVLYMLLKIHGFQWANFA